MVDITKQKQNGDRLASIVIVRLFSFLPSAGTY